MALFTGHQASILHSRRSVTASGDNCSQIAFKNTRCPSIHQNGLPRPTLRPITHIAAAAIVEPVAAADVPPSTASEGTDSKRKPTASKDGVEKPIIVGDKPAANSLLKRLEQTPQTLIRACSNSDYHTYRTITTIASAQGQISQQDKVLLYVPFTKAATFTAIVLPSSPIVQQSSSTGSSGILSAGSSNSSTPVTLTVKNSTDSTSLTNTLTFDLIKHGSVVLTSAGAASTAKAAAALQSARQQLLSRGYEVGVMPRFQEGTGQEAAITVLSQQVVLQELPVPRVRLPRNEKKSLSTAAAAAQALLIKQRRVQLLVPHDQLGRLSNVLGRVMQTRQPKGPRQAEKGQVASESKRRLLLVWPPSTADQLLESLEQLNQFTPTPVPESEDRVDTSSSSDSGGSSFAAPAEAPAVDQESMLQLQLRSSRLTSIPSPQGGPTGPGFRDDRKPAVATAESSVTGLAGAVEARVARAGAAWLWSDGSAQGNAAAWEALILASNKMDAADGAGGLLALVDVQQLQPQRGKRARQARSSSSKNDQGQQAEEGQEQQQDAAAAATDEKQQLGKGSNGQQQREGSYRLRMLVMRDSDVARSILQSPNSPLEVSVSADLWPLLKFTTAANTFLPLSASTGTGGLIMLPAVLPVTEPAAAVAVDYRFADQKQQQVPYAIRLQRFTGKLPKGMEVEDSQQLRVSLSTDPIKLRDAIVAKVLQQQPASVRFVGPLGRTPPLLTIAMAAVAAARVRLQQKGAPVDVGVMPYAETLLASAGAGAADGSSKDKPTAAEAAEIRGKAGRVAGRRQQQTGSSNAGFSSQSGRMVYSLRLVPLPAAPAAPADADVVPDVADADADV